MDLCHSIKTLPPGLRKLSDGRLYALIHRQTPTKVAPRQYTLNFHTEHLRVTKLWGASKPNKDKPEVFYALADATTDYGVDATHVLLRLNTRRQRYTLEDGKVRYIAIVSDIAVFRTDTTAEQIMNLLIDDATYICRPPRQGNGRFSEVLIVEMEA